MIFTTTKCSGDEYWEYHDDHEDGHDDVDDHDDDEDDDDENHDDENLALLNDDKTEYEKHDSSNCSEETNYHTLIIIIIKWCSNDA